MCPCQEAASVRSGLKLLLRRADTDDHPRPNAGSVPLRGDARTPEMKDIEHQSWILEAFLDGEPVVRRFTLRAFPARIGRSSELEVPLPAAQISSCHAELYLDANRLWLRDLGSTNGTFVNRARVTDPVEIDSGDVIRVANTELLVGNELLDSGWLGETRRMPPSVSLLATGVLSRAQALQSLILNDEVAVALQPIVSLSSHGLPGFELLGRGASRELPTLPGPLFAIAGEAGLAAALSRCFRVAGLDAAATLPRLPNIYINVHPAELDEGVLIRDLALFRERSPSLPLVVEVHESTVADPQAMRRLKVALAELDVGLAYDDFGAGQARLLELAECPPDCLKFDMSLIRDIDTAPESRQRMVETLVRIARDMGVPCLAEGIEHAGEFDACRALGFELAQGYFVARPAPVENWQTPWKWSPPARDVDAERAEIATARRPRSPGREGSGAPAAQRRRSPAR